MTQTADTPRGLNAATLTLIMIGIGFPLTFAQSVWLNTIVAGLGLLYLIALRVSWRKVSLILLIALPLAFGSWISFWFFGTVDRWYLAWMYGSRVYAYLLLGMIVTMTVSTQRWLVSLHLHFHLPNAFVFGLLGALNMADRVRHEFRRIQYSALMRGENLRLWNPLLYLRIVLVSLNWSNDLAEAMTSQGFTENAPRTELIADPMPAWQWGLAGGLIVIYCAAAFGLRPW